MSSEKTFVIDKNKALSTRKFYSLLLKLCRVTVPRKNVIDQYYEKDIEDKTILISGLGRNVRGSMQYLLNELNSRDEFKDYKIYVRTNHKRTDEIVKGYIEKNGWKRTRTVNRKLSEKMESCKYLITESYFPYIWIKKPGQVMIDIWHGTPLKRLGVLKSGDKCHRTAVQQKNFLSADYLLYPNEFTRDVMWDSYRITSLIKAKALMLGYPRTAGILQITDEEADDLRKQLAPNGEHIYAYMPTFRGNLNDEEAVRREAVILDYLDERLRDDQILYVNLHHHIKGGLDYGKYKHIKQFPPLIDSYSILAVAETLISDYSSVFFDYLVKRGHIILFIEDIDEYLSFQGLNLDIESLPFDLARSKDDIIEMLDRGKTYDDTEFFNMMCSHDAADNPEKLCRLFLGSEEGLDIEPIPDNDKLKILLYAEDLPAGSSTDRLREINKKYDWDKAELYIGCDEYKTDVAPDAAYPLLHESLVLASRDEQMLSSIGLTVMDLYKKGRMSFRRAVKLLCHDYALFTERMLGGAHMDVIGIYDAVEPAAVIGLALSRADKRILFVNSRMRDEIRGGNTLLADAVRYAADYCSLIVAESKEAENEVAGIIGKENLSRLVVAETAEDVLRVIGCPEKK